MSFGTFASKYGSEPQIPMDLHIEADHPFGFVPIEGENTTDPSVMPNMPIGGDVLPPSAEPTITPPQMPKLPDLPWSLIIPAGIIAVVAAGVAWYMNGKKMPEIPI